MLINSSLMQDNKTNFARFYEGYLGLFALVLLVAPKLIALLFIGFIPLIIVGMKKKELHFQLRLLSVLWMALYVGYLAYSLATRHPDLAGRYIENKLSFLLLPLMLSFRLKEVLSFRYLVYGFLLGTGFLLIESFVGSFICYARPGSDIHCFLASEFSRRHHPSYTSVYYITAIAFLWYGYQQRFAGFRMWIVAAGTALLVVASGLCLSLAGILYLFAAIGAVFLWMIYRSFGKWIALVAAAITPVLLYICIVTIPYVHGEWANAKGFADEYVKDPDTFVKNKHYPMSGTEVRLVMWTVSAKVSGDYPLGVGTGNVDEVLTTYLNRMGQNELAKQEYNPHNQYLQTAIELGWAGLLLLISILAVGCVEAFRNRNAILLLVVTNLAFNMLFESMLQRQSGIVFYPFIICLLYIYGTYRKPISAP